MRLGRLLVTILIFTNVLDASMFTENGQELKEKASVVLIWAGCMVQNDYITFKYICVYYIFYMNGG